MSFDFDRDTFAFANELLWEYQVDPTTRKTYFQRRIPAPSYSHRCFGVVRSARQFWYHSTFEPELPRIAPKAYRCLAREVLARSPRIPSATAERVRFPGYTGLRTLSQDHEGVLKEESGSAWESYFLRSHWRMVFPISRRHQALTAGRLLAALDAGLPPIVHLVRFPQLTINHGMLVYGHRASGSAIAFEAYDPNDVTGPATLQYEPATRAFSLPPNHYWAGGQLDVIHIYRNPFF